MENGNQIPPTSEHNPVQVETGRASAILQVCRSHKGKLASIVLGAASLAAAFLGSASYSCNQAGHPDSPAECRVCYGLPA